MITLIATAAMGLESVLARELKVLGFSRPSDAKNLGWIVER